MYDVRFTNDELRITTESTKKAQRAQRAQRGREKRRCDFRNEYLVNGDFRGLFIFNLC